ncbi:MAG: response regulator [Actinobacteria bacterium]|nr:response regulator [Actinomycetota bacterium]
MDENMEPTVASPKRVLIVDDEASLRTLVRANLEVDGLQVSEAVDGNEAMAMLKKSQPDLILLDIMMPGKDGIEVLEDLASDEKLREIPVVLLTAKGEQEDLERGASLGARGHITKPFDPEQMVRTVKAALGIMRR